MSGKKNNNHKKPYTPKGAKPQPPIKASSAKEAEPKPHTELEANKETNTKTNTQTINVSAPQSTPKPEKKETPTLKPEQKQEKKMSEKTKNGLCALGLIGGTIVLGIIATLLGGKLDESYKMPPMYPPEWVFPVVWTILYISIGIASYIAFLSVGKDPKKRKMDLIWYGIHLFFNIMWPLFYFTLNWLIFSCVWLLFVVITAIIVTYRFYRASLASGIIFTIYTIWLLYALYLSMGITILNAI